MGVGSAGGRVAREVGNGAGWGRWVCDGLVGATLGEWEGGGEGSGVGGVMNLGLIA